VTYRYRGFKVQVTAKPGGGSCVRWWTPLLAGPGATVFHTCDSSLSVMTWEVARARIDEQISIEADEVLIASAKLAAWYRQNAGPDSTTKGFKS
jgi:hypothetical protein